uniref:Uncharacterized protein n=1 Tax=Ciona savignyi TaxID=51511 RepID=H2Z0G2_CIOSA
DRYTGTIRYGARQYRNPNAYGNRQNRWDDEVKRFIQNHGHGYQRTVQNHSNYRPYNGFYQEHRAPTGDFNPRYHRQHPLRHPNPDNQRPEFRPAYAQYRPAHTQYNNSFRSAQQSRGVYHRRTTSRIDNNRPSDRSQRTVPPYLRQPTILERKRGIADEPTETTCAICLDEMDKLEVKRLKGVVDPTVTLPCA